MRVYLDAAVVSKDDLIVKVQNKVIRVICRTKKSDIAWKIVEELVLPIKILYRYELVEIIKYGHLKVF